VGEAARRRRITAERQASLQGQEAHFRAAVLAARQIDAGATRTMYHIQKRTAE
jgi:hypothetical protein